MVTANTIVLTGVQMCQAAGLSRDGSPYSSQTHQCDLATWLKQSKHHVRHFNRSNHGSLNKLSSLGSRSQNSSGSLNLKRSSFFSSKSVNNLKNRHGSERVLLGLNKRSRCPLTITPPGIDIVMNSLKFKSRKYKKGEVIYDS